MGPVICDRAAALGGPTGLEGSAPIGDKELRCRRTIDFRAIAEPIAIASPLALIISAQEPVMATVAILFLAHSWRERDWRWVRRGWFLAALALWLYALARTIVTNPTATVPAHRDDMLFIALAARDRLLGRD
jgi:hypothetical protein